MNQFHKQGLRAPLLTACLALCVIADAAAQSTLPNGTTTAGEGAAANGDHATAVGKNALADKENSTATGAGSAALEFGASAFGASSIANASESVAVGYRSFANDANGTALGANANAFGRGASAFGSGANTSADYATAAGYGAVASGLGGVAYGAHAQATAPASVAVGSQAINETGEPMVEDGLGQPVPTSAGFGGTAVGASATATAQGSAYGLGAEASGSSGTALGAFARAEGESSLAAGLGASATSKFATALGVGSIADAVNSVALGAHSEATRANTVSVGRQGAERQITSVAAGTEATDAINLGQFKSALGASVGGIYMGIDDLNGRVAALDRRIGAGNQTPDAATQIQEALTTARNYADAGDRQTLTQSKAYTDQQVGGLARRSELDDLRQRVNDRFNTLDTRINRVGAIGVAMSLMSSSAQGFDGNSLGVAVGGYRGEGALSIGLSRQLSARARLTLGTAIAGGGETAGGVGLGIGL